MWYTLITCPTDPLSDGPTVLVTLRGFVRARSRQAGISFKRLSAFSVTPWHGNTLGSQRGELRNPLEVVYHTCECCRCKCRLVFIHLMPFFFFLIWRVSVSVSLCIHINLFNLKFNLIAYLFGSAIFTYFILNRFYKCIITHFLFFKTYRPDK